ncbi:MAG: twin-arginine translocation signal domain-containing protein [Planctomycetaceae bacterium]
MQQVNRRHFLKTSSTLAAATSLGAFTSTPPVRADSPNERPTFAVIGCGGQGKGYELEL